MVILNLNVYFINVYNVKFCNKIMIIRFVLYWMYLVYEMIL